MKNAIIVWCILLCTFSCSEKENDTINLNGSWQLTEKYCEGESISLSDCEKGELVSFCDKNVCYMFMPCDSNDLRTAWVFKDGILNISDLLPVSFYVDNFTDNNFTIRYYSYSEFGDLLQYQKCYKKVETVLVDGKLRLKE